MAVDTNIFPPRYRGARLIARGGMGEIYRATDDVLGRAVAIKLLADRYSVDDEVGRRFTREALAAARLSGQPNTVTIFDVGEWNERPFIVMEYLPGGSLADKLSLEGPQSPDRVLPWLAEAAEALDSAHRNGVVHRDVKPANLLLDRDGVVHVADFGIASAAGLVSLTTTGTMLGTVGYLSPEQAQGAATTPASDCYALAITAFELLTGQRPFQRASATAEASAHLHAPIPLISDRGSQLPHELDSVFERALAKSPSVRYPSCTEFAAELGDALRRAAGSTLLLPGEPPTQPLRAPLRAPRRVFRLPLIAAGAAAAVAGIISAVLLGMGGERTAVRTVTLPGATVSATVTESTTVQQTITPTPSSTLARRPSSAEGHALNDEGYAMMRSGDYEGALPLLRQGVEKLRGVGPSDMYEAYANYNLGYTLVQLGRCEEALGYLRVAERLENHRDVGKAIKRAEKCLKRGGGKRESESRP